MRRLGFSQARWLLIVAAAVLVIAAVVRAVVVAQSDADLLRAPDKAAVAIPWTLIVSPETWW